MRIESIEREILPDYNADLSWLDGPYEDAEHERFCKARIDAFDRGEWWMVGVQAVAEIRFDNDSRLRIESPGLWGIESDSGEDYFQSVYLEELDQLGEMLHELGVGASEILGHAPELCRHEANEAS